MLEQNTTKMNILRFCAIDILIRFKFMEFNRTKFNYLKNSDQNLYFSLFQGPAMFDFSTFDIVASPSA